MVVSCSSQPYNLKEFTMRYVSPIWHPCSQMQDYEQLPPLSVIGASGAYIELASGQTIIDAISSWWCKSLGHQHPRLKKALQSQLEKFEHVILANTTNETIEALSEKLTQLTKTLKKVMYAGDGSCAVEIAMKMSLHARTIQGDRQRHKFLALANGYHGETIGALSVSDVGMYRAPYQPLLFETHFIQPIPYVTSTADPLWNNCEVIWKQLEPQLAQYAEHTTAVLVEPIVQGAGGMKIYSQDFLRRLRAWTTQHNIHLIADEIMTGLGRTGKMLACEHANIEPEFLCLSKALTAGWLPFSAVLTTDAIYDVFYADYKEGKSFLHSHTYSGNVLAASVALAALQVLEDENLCQRAAEIGMLMRNNMDNIAEKTKKLTNVRGIGAIVAADLIPDGGMSRQGFDVYRAAIKLGALLRPLGNTIYWLPPLNVEKDTLDKLSQITEQALFFR